MSPSQLQTVNNNRRNITPSTVYTLILGFLGKCTKNPTKLYKKLIKVEHYSNKKKSKLKSDDISITTCHIK